MQSFVVTFLVFRFSKSRGFLYFYIYIVKFCFFFSLVFSLAHLKSIKFTLSVIFLSEISFVVGRCSYLIFHDLYSLVVF